MRKLVSFWVLRWLKNIEGFPPIRSAIWLCYPICVFVQESITSPEPIEEVSACKKEVVEGHSAEVDSPLSFIVSFYTHSMSAFQIIVTREPGWIVAWDPLDFSESLAPEADVDFFWNHFLNPNLHWTIHLSGTSTFNTGNNIDEKPYFSQLNVELPTIPHHPNEADEDAFH